MASRPVNASIRVNTRSISRIVTNLRELERSSLISNSDLTKYGQEALRYLTRLFPKSREQRSSGSQQETGPRHLVEGWISEPLRGLNKVGFSVTHLLARDERISTILRSLDTGSRAYTWEPDRDLHFIVEKRKKGKDRWMTLVEGEDIEKEARRGWRYTDRTAEFVLTRLLPKMRKSVQRQAREIMDR